MGELGWKPMLHVGGVQEAITVAPPGLLPLTAPPVTVTDEGRDDDQVSGTPVMVVPLVSITTAVNVFEPLLLKAKELTGVLSASSVICCTAQVRKFMGTLVVPPTETNIGLVPGVLAVTWAWFASSPVAVVLRVPTAAVDSCQVGIPTVAEISTPVRVLAITWNSRMCPLETQPATVSGSVGDGSLDKATFSRVTLAMCWCT